MRRVVSVWLPTWATDRVRISASPPPGPLVTVLREGQKMVLAGVDAEARAVGLRPGMGLTQARVLVPGLNVVPAEPEADAAGLIRLAGWCLRYAPLVAPDPPDGLWLDITGCAHLFDGEGALLRSVIGRLHGAGFAARAAVADTPGAAHVLARHGDTTVAVAPVGGQKQAIAALPPAALRLDQETLDTFHRLGIAQISQLIEMPRGPLTKRFGGGVLLRLDQALGRVAEPIAPMTPPEVIGSRLGFLEPLLTAEAFAAAIGQLAERVCIRMERKGVGARRLDLLFQRVDGSVQAVRIGTARPNRDAAHLARLLTERLDTVDPGLGIEAMRLVVSLAEPLGAIQMEALGKGRGPDLATLVDALVNRLGNGRVYRVAPVESDVPERSVRRIPAMAPFTGKTWPAFPRPVRQLSPPLPVEALSMLPDHPPAAFTWRGRRFRVRRADGPERIYGEWWRNAAEARASRDYWRVEDQDGRRFWLFRRGDGEDVETGDLQWFLQGVGGR